MDWIKQRSFQNWVTGILVALNLLVLTVVWVQSGRNNPPPRREGGSPSTVSVELMQRELRLSEEQAKDYERLRTEQMGSMRGINDQLDSLKSLLVDTIFDPRASDQDVESLVARIGELQSQLEKLRFSHFSALARICDREQREKLRPILQEVIGRKQGAKPSAAPGQERGPRPGGEPERRTPQRGDRQAPPTLDEKLDRYVQRLSLTTEQTKAVERILRTTRANEESFRSQRNPTEDEFEREKQKLREQEDRSIMKILDQRQKNEFEQMIKNRPSPSRN